MLTDALDLEQYGVVAVENGVITHVHREEACERRGGGCWIHRPTQDWPLAGRPVYYEARRALSWRSCEHNVLHPDIDAVEYMSQGITRYPSRGVQPGDPDYHPACDG